MFVESQLSLSSDRTIGHLSTSGASLHIARGLPSNFAALHSLELSSFDPEVAFNLRQIQSLLRNPRADYWVLFHGEQIIGQLIMLRQIRRNGVHARIYSLTIDPAYRMRGLARRLLNWGLAVLRNQGVRRVSLEVEACAIGPQQLYRSLGFIEERSLDHYYGEDRHGIKMGRDLEA